MGFQGFRATSARFRENVLAQPASKNALSERGGLKVQIASKFVRRGGVFKASVRSGHDFVEMCWALPASKNGLSERGGVKVRIASKFHGRGWGFQGRGRDLVPILVFCNFFGKKGEGGRRLPKYGVGGGAILNWPRLRRGQKKAPRSGAKYRILGCFSQPSGKARALTAGGRSSNPAACILAWAPARPRRTTRATAQMH